MPNGHIDPTLMDIFRTVLSEQRGQTKPQPDESARVVVRGNGNFIALGGGGLHIGSVPGRPAKQRRLRRSK